MQSEISRKITEAYNSKDFNYRDLVYILSRIRKILEINNEKGKYKLLKFYCNWSLHPDLGRKNTTNIISTMFDKDIDPNLDARTIARKLSSNHAQFFKFTDLKNDLSEFYADPKNDLPVMFIDDRKRWPQFIRLMLGIVEDCPVVCIKSSKKIDSMILENSNGTYQYKFCLHHTNTKPIVKLKF